MADTTRAGAALKRWREAKGLTQEQAAEKLATSQPMISTVERTGVCSVHLLRRMVRLYEPQQSELAEVLEVTDGAEAAS